MIHIDSKGNVWPCVAHIGDGDFFFGNINEQSFDEIWEGEQRQKALKLLDDKDLSSICQSACRLDEINKYLNEIRHPGAHVNFI